MTRSKAGITEPSFPVDRSENVVVRYNGRYWVPRRRGGWRQVTPMSESEFWFRDDRALKLIMGGAGGMLIGWVFSIQFDQWSWGPPVGLLIGLLGVVALVAGLTLLVRQRKFVAFVVPAADDLFGMAKHLGGLPKLIDLDSTNAR